MKPPFFMVLGLLAFAGTVAADTKLVANPSPHARLPIEQWDGIQVEFPYPIYLADEQFNYSITVTNTTANAFPLKDGRLFDGKQLVWIPHRDGREIEFSGNTAFGDENGSFERSPLEVVGHDLRNWSIILQDREVLQPGQSKEFLTSTGGMWLDTQPHPDSLVPYLLTTDRLLVGAPVPIQVDPRRVRDFPAIKTDGDARTQGRSFHEVMLDGERFVYTDSGYRMCRIPTGVNYKIVLSLDEIPGKNGGSWTRRTMTVKFLGATEPDYVGVLQTSETWSGTAQTDPKLWAKSLPKAANQPADVVEPAVETSSKASPAPGPVTRGKPSLWPWVGLAVGCVLLLAAALFIIRRKG
jgi:hypothetical protein